MASAAALAIFSGKIIYKFGIPERLRTLRYSIFTGGVVTGNSSFTGQVRCLLLRSFVKNASPESPQTFRACSISKYYSADYSQSAAEAIYIVYAYQTR